MNKKSIQLFGIFLALLLPVGASAQSFAPREPRPEIRRSGSQKFLRISMAVLAAATVADTASSWNRRELNPLLQGPNGRFGAKGMSLKFGLAGSVISVQWLVTRKAPQTERTFAITNLALSGLLSGVAIHNSLLPR
ncbi:MAG: hypothetical protein ABJF23_07300 [Bryobacteraceae bacterium]